jgi:outer membrane autotransporter protein
VANLEGIYDLAKNGDPDAEVALRQLIGEEALTSANAAHENVSLVNTAISGRFNALHYHNYAPPAGYGDTFNRLWVDGYGTWSKQKDSNSVRGYDFDAAGIVLGYDREIEAVSGLTLGLSGSYLDGEVKNNDGLAKTDIETVSVGIYETYEFNNGFLLDANLAYSFAQNDADIYVPLVQARKKSSFVSQSFLAELDLGYAYHLSEDTRLIPSVGLRYIRVKQDGWQEKIVSDPDNNAVANWFGDSKNNFLEIPLTLKFQTTFETENVTFKPEVRVGGVISANSPKNDLRMGFVGIGDSTVLQGIDSGKSRLQAGAGLRFQFNNDLDVFVNYDFEARSKYQSHIASLGLGFSF